VNKETPAESKNQERKRDRKMNPFEIEEAWYGYNMWEHVEYRFKPEFDDNTGDSLPDNVTTFEENMR
jgi:hypothetical protein